MAFYGNHFSFNGIPCEKFGLALYDIGSTTQSDNEVASVGEVVSDWIPSRAKSFFYGVQQNDPLKFDLIFGVNPELNHNGKFPTMEDYLDRWEIQKINNWLTNHKDGYKYLEIEQADMEDVRFLCAITDLKIITYGWHPWAFSCNVTCDSPYGYLKPKTYSYECDGSTTISFNNLSTTNDNYYPKIVITPTNTNTGDITIRNVTDGNRDMIFTDLGNTGAITIDNENGIVTCANNLNLYDNFNFNFFRLLPDINTLTLTGDFSIDIYCEFPVDVGG